MAVHTLASDPKLWWYLARAGGFVTWGLVAASVVWGLLLSTRLFPRPRPAWVLDLHRALGATALVFTAVHLSGLALDHYVHFGLSELFVPLAAHWHPEPVAWGVVGFYLLVAIQVTSLARRHIPQGLWRAVHTSSFALYLLGSVHAIRAGTDAGPVFVWTVIATSGLILFLVAIRLLSPMRVAVQARQAPARTPSQAAQQAWTPSGVR